MSCATLLQVGALAFALSRPALAQSDTVAAPVDSGSAWLAATMGYAHYGDAETVEGWIAVGHFAGAFHLSQAYPNSADRGENKQLGAVMAGVRVPIGPLRIIGALGGGSAYSSASAASERGMRTVWEVLALWPLGRHVALQGERYATFGGGKPYIIDTFGVAIGGFR